MKKLSSLQVTVLVIAVLLVLTTVLYVWSSDFTGGISTPKATVRFEERPNGYLVTIETVHPYTIEEEQYYYGVMSSLVYWEVVEKNGDNIAKGILKDSLHLDPDYINNASRRIGLVSFISNDTYSRLTPNSQIFFHRGLFASDEEDEMIRLKYSLTGGSIISNLMLRDAIWNPINFSNPAPLIELNTSNDFNGNLTASAFLSHSRISVYTNWSINWELSVVVTNNDTHTYSNLSAEITMNQTAQFFSNLEIQSNSKTIFTFRPQATQLYLEHNKTLNISISIVSEDNQVLLEGELQVERRWAAGRL